MKRLVLGCGVFLILLNATACGLGWKHRGGALTLPESRYYESRSQAAPPDAGSAAGPVAGSTAAPRRISLMLPDGWNWVMRGDDFVATRDGVFLQNILVERIHVDQVEQSDGMFPLAALSSKQWPLRTVKSMKKRLEPGMSPVDAADVLLDSRRNDPAVAGLEIREVATRTIAGSRAFKAVFDFRLKDPGPRKGVFDPRLVDPGRIPPYRSVYYGIMLDEWFYGIGYTAVLRHYFQKDAETFESMLQSVVLTDR